jgi:hypothetical protein
MLKKGYIYKIFSFQTDDIYIGSTIVKLSVRMSKHRSDYKCKRNYCSAFELVKYPDAKIELLEIVEYTELVELKAIEGTWQRKLACVNRQIAYRTPEEKIEYRKKYKVKLLTAKCTATLGNNTA